MLTGVGGNFCLGGDVHGILKPLTKMTLPELLEFTRMTDDLVKAMRGCPQLIVVAVNGICAGAGAGAMMVLTCDLWVGTAQARIALLFNRVGLAGADMDACVLLRRMICRGQA